MIKKLFLLTSIMLSAVAFPLIAQCPGQCDCEQGAQGPSGAQGFAGNQGPMGSQGPAGIPGPVGEVGPCCSFGLPGWANLYSQLSQTINPFNTAGDTVLFEGINSATSGVDTSLAAINGSITINSDGLYKIDISAQGFNLSFANIWSLALYLDGLFVPGSSFGGFNDNTGEVGQSSEISVTIPIIAPQVLTVRSNSTTAFNLVNSGFNNDNPIASVTIKIEQLTLEP